MAYGIKTTNVFELLGESEGGDEAPPVVKASEIKKKEAPSKVPENAKPDAPGERPIICQSPTAKEHESGCRSRYRQQCWS